MLGECGGRADEVSYKAVLHKACRELAIGGSSAHVILVAREQEQRGRGRGCREGAGCSM
jgi:hypothetical protein